MVKNIGFIGLGSMGQGMAGQLLKHGFNVYGFDVDKARASDFASRGGVVCNSVKDVCVKVNIIITMLPRDEHVCQVLLSAEGVVACASKGTLVLEMSTIFPATSIELNNELTKAGLRMMDAPVGRTPQDAANGTLLVMAGGNKKDFDSATPIFQAMADKIIYLGPAGSGIRMKIINNYMSMVSMVVTAETLAMASKAGIDMFTATEVLQNTVAGRGQININFPRKVLAGDITPDFPIVLGRKDLALALKLGEELKTPLYLGAVASQLFGTACAQGRSDQDCTAMLLAIEELGGSSDALS
jgi:3-hydroxyisobutyrate dehydrogenase-like beta-hydroxyacid dehydrogenase